MSQKFKAYLQIHIAVFLYGFTAILGHLITVAELPLVWWRILLTCSSLLFFPIVLKTIRTLPKSLVLKLAFIGMIIALHWVFFFGAIKYSNVSVTLVCLATTTFFTSFLEPLFFKKKIRWVEVLLGLAIVPGMYLVVNASFDMITGIWMGILSALLAAMFSIANKKYVEETDPYTITFIELGSGWILLCILLPFFLQLFPDALFIPTGMDWVYLVILALLCTTLAFILTLNALKYLTAFSANLTINLEPVYGILMAWIFFNENEQVGDGFYQGVLIILLAVFLYPILNKKLSKQ